MKTGETDIPEDEQIREKFDEYTVGSSTVGMISDPLNEHAWIQSTKTTQVRP